MKLGTPSLLAAATIASLAISSFAQAQSNRKRGTVSNQGGFNLVNPGGNTRTAGLNQGFTQSGGQISNPAQTQPFVPARTQPYPNNNGQLERQIINEIGNALTQMNRPRPVPFPGGNNNTAGLNQGFGQYGRGNNAARFAPSYGSNSVANLNNNGFSQGGQNYQDPGVYNVPGYVPQGNPYYNSPGYYPQTNTVYNQPTQEYAQYDYATQPASYSQPAGQQYQIPAGYGGVGVGSVVNYGGASYVINANGTMSPSSGSSAATPTTTAAVQRYQVPAQYAGTPAGYVINYGGVNYLTSVDGTMSPY